MSKPIVPGRAISSHARGLNLLWFGVVTLVCCAPARPVCAQASLRESLERLDRNENGEIDPHEITALARPYLERLAETRRLSLDRSNDIEDFQEAARIYHALKNGVAETSVASTSRSTVQSFRPSDNQVLVPEFGAEVKYPYTQDDLDQADERLRRYDRNGDGAIDQREAANARWTHLDPFASDIDQDGRLSRLELCQRYARRRMLDAASGELVQKSKRVGNGIRPSESSRRAGSDDSQWWRRGGSNTWLAASLLGRFDSDRNGRLDTTEAQNIGIAPGLIDINRDGELSRSELQAYLSDLQDEAGSDIEGIPGWFYERDSDRDGQVAMAEYSRAWTDAEFAEFNALDINQDGLLTAKEVANSRAVMGGTFSSPGAEILPPRKTIVSEIEITEDFIIRDVNLQISITHTNVGSLDAYLTGPDGQRIELFTEVGGSGDHFDHSTFDDQAELPIIKAQPPYSGTFIPEGRVRGQPGLSEFNGTHAQGVWQLSIRATRSDRFGMLNNWSLVFETQEDPLSIAAPESPAPSTSSES
ncbi:MAG: proprotein convertase P-domain-containing protein [Pirellulaceae bacterium]